MKLTKSQCELLHQWHRLDQAAGCRQWRKPIPKKRRICNRLANAGLLLVQYSSLKDVMFMLTDEAVNLIEKGGES